MSGGGRQEEKDRKKDRLRGAAGRWGATWDVATGRALYTPDLGIRGASLRMIHSDIFSICIQKPAPVVKYCL